MGEQLRCQMDYTSLDSTLGGSNNHINPSSVRSILGNIRDKVHAASDYFDEFYRAIGGRRELVALQPAGVHHQMPFDYTFFSMSRRRNSYTSGERMEHDNGERMRRWRQSNVVWNRNRIIKSAVYVVLALAMSVAIVYFAVKVKDVGKEKLREGIQRREEQIKKVIPG